MADPKKPKQPKQPLQPKQPVPQHSDLLYRPKPEEYLPHKPGEVPKRAQPPQYSDLLYRPKPGEYLPHKPGEVPERAHPPQMVGGPYRPPGQALLDDPPKKADIMRNRARAKSVRDQIEEMKRRESNPLTPEMINKANSGDK
jgi:hypothetical protein